MKKRFIHIALISVSASLAVMLLLAIPLTLSVYFHDIQVELRGMLVLIASDEAQMEADPQGFAISRGDMLGSNERDIRLTILTPEGEVLADSHTADRYSEAGKDEISQAREEGWGFDIHKSARLGKYCYYVAYYNGSYIYNGGTLSELYRRCVCRDSGGRPALKIFCQAFGAGRAHPCQGG